MKAKTEEIHKEIMSNNEQQRMRKTQRDDDGVHPVWATSLGLLPMGVASYIMMKKLPITSTIPQLKSSLLLRCNTMASKSLYKCVSPLC